MESLAVDVMAVSAGADLTYLCGYEAMPLERITMLVIGMWDEPTLVVPELEAPRVSVPDDLFRVRPWSDGEDMVDVVASELRHHGRPNASIAVGDNTWASVLMGLQKRLYHARWLPASVVTRDLRIVKAPEELDALREAGAAIDAVVSALPALSWAGRTEADLAEEIASMILDEGHEKVNFVIVASGPNAASPHHEPGRRRVESGECVLVDIGGTRQGYCSDTTRVVAVGEPPPEVLRAWEALREAQEAALRAGRPGATAESVDAVARERLAAEGYAEFFIHRTGHGIGMEAHEDPYIVAGNQEELRSGMCYSVEPGVYVPGRFGLRLEDIVAVTADGVEALNRTPHQLLVVG